MPKLSQIIAAEGGVKSRTFTELTEAHHKVQKTQLLSGLSRTYRAKDEEGEKLPSESIRVQVQAKDMIEQTVISLTRLFDVVATKDFGNQLAGADIVVGGRTLVVNAPVTYLLFLEKQLTDIHTFVKKLPVLDSAENWEFDTQTDTWKTAPVTTHRTKKVLRNHVKSEATDRHPAQVETFTEDETVGYWTLTKFSGALPAAAVAQLLDRVAQLQLAVKFAREEANSLEISQKKVGADILGWIFDAS